MVVARQWVGMYMRCDATGDIDGNGEVLSHEGIDLNSAMTEHTGRALKNMYKFPFRRVKTQ